VRSAARASDVVLIGGESGAGKEHAARTYHASGPHANGPFVALNAATIPEGVAERVLFGARRGAFSGAVDAEGTLAAAHGGVLFLDEIGELSLETQAKLLRFCETREVIALGATTPRRVNARLCFATHRDLRAAVAEGRFRADFYYRIAQMEVTVPPLRQRAEEIPWIVAGELARQEACEPSRVHASFLEACLLRPWPGNVRELLGAVRRAVQNAGGAPLLRAEHLDARAGRPLASAPPGPKTEPPREPEDPAAAERRRIVDALAQAAGNQTAAAQLLGMSLRTLINRIETYDIPRPRGSKKGTA
jgi:transcriptional regulator with PAS, ATPase and Fis domain